VPQSVSDLVSYQQKRDLAPSDKSRAVYWSISSFDQRTRGGQEVNNYETSAGCLRDRVSMVSCNQIWGDWAISTNRMEAPFGLSLLISYTLGLALVMADGRIAFASLLAAVRLLEVCALASMQPIKTNHHQGFSHHRTFGGSVVHHFENVGIMAPCLFRS
jgi:hypothetical protein